MKKIKNCYLVPTSKELSPPLSVPTLKNQGMAPEWSNLHTKQWKKKNLMTEEVLQAELLDLVILDIQDLVLQDKLLPIKEHL